MLKIKVSPEEKIRAVESYLRGGLGTGGITRQLRISNQAFQAWVRKYKTFGVNGLLSISKRAIYTAEVKNRQLRIICQERDHRQKFVRNTEFIQNMLCGIG